MQPSPRSAPPATLIATLTLLVGLTLLAGCEPPAKPLRMHMPAYRQFDPALMQALFSEQSKLEIVSAVARPGMSSLDALLANEADLALVENSASFVPGVRAVLPIYESVLHILVRDEFVFPAGEQWLQGASFYIVNQSAAGNEFVDLVMKRQRLGKDHFSKPTVIEPGITDFIIYFGPINPQNTNWYHAGYSLISLTDDDEPESRFFQEGIGYTAPTVEPFEIPPFTYQLPGSEEALQTVSVDALLITRKEIPEEVIYELTRTFLQEKQRLVAIAPHLFSGINESFDPLDLSFPLHSGTRRYLRRDEPEWLERYAESINLLVYLVFLLLTGVLGFNRWRAQRKKDRVDLFYTRVLEIRDRMPTEPATNLLAELETLERSAFDALIAEKLAADESFRIFIDLMARLRSDLAQGDRSTGDSKAFPLDPGAGD